MAYIVMAYIVMALRQTFRSKPASACRSTRPCHGSVLPCPIVSLTRATRHQEEPGRVVHDPRRYGKKTFVVHGYVAMASYVAMQLWLRQKSICMSIDTSMPRRCLHGRATHTRHHPPRRESRRRPGPGEPRPTHLLFLSEKLPSMYIGAVCLAL